MYASEVMYAIGNDKQASQSQSHAGCYVQYNARDMTVQLI